MGEHVLTITCAIMKSSKRTDSILTHIVNAKIKDHLLTFFVDYLVDLLADLLYDFFNSGRVNTSVLYQTFQGYFCNLFAHRIKTRKHHRFRCIINDDIYPGQGLQS